MWISVYPKQLTPDPLHTSALQRRPYSVRVPRLLVFPPLAERWRKDFGSLIGTSGRELRIAPGNPAIIYLHPYISRLELGHFLKLIFNFG